MASIKTASLKLPATTEDLRALEIGTVVYLTGRIFTAREGVYKRAIEDLAGMPASRTALGTANFHCSPAAAVNADGSYTVGAVTATASFRFGKWLEGWFELSGCNIIIGKGGMTSEVYRRHFVPNSATLHMINQQGKYTRDYMGMELSAAGGMVSTMDDMLRWMKHMDAPIVGTAPGGEAAPSSSRPGDSLVRRWARRAMAATAAALVIGFAARFWLRGGRVEPIARRPPPLVASRPSPPISTATVLDNLAMVIELADARWDPGDGPPPAVGDVLGTSAVEVAEGRIRSMSTLNTSATT